MIVSRAHKFIFVRTEKVAGTSIEFALSRHCKDANDVITPISAPDEVFRYQFGVVPRNYAQDIRVEKEYEKIVAAGNLSRITSAHRSMRPTMVFWNHMEAMEIRDRVGVDFWNDAFKFSVIRHPYDFVLSQLYYHLSEIGLAADSRWAHWYLLKIVLRGARNHKIVSVEGDIAVDKLLRYESLTDGLKEIASRIGVDISEALPRAKGNLRPPWATVESQLSPVIRWLIRLRWKREFAAFSYGP
jgi:hypothetical protein